MGFLKAIDRSLKEAEDFWAGREDVLEK